MEHADPPCQVPPLLEVRDLTVSLGNGADQVRALEQVSFCLKKGQTVGVIGESGSGKSTLARTLLRLLPRTGKILAGQVLLDGRDLLRLPESAMQRIRGSRLGLIFQEPGTALNPLVKIAPQLIEGPRHHGAAPAPDLRRQGESLLREVGVPDPGRCLESYPHELSVGMQQRVLLAMTLLSQPDLVIADEPTASLDSVNELQVLDLLSRAVSRRRVALLLISHDWDVVRRATRHILVLRQGRVVARGSPPEISAVSESYVRDLVARP